ncbi:MAG TPA: hypothetical protein VF789_33495 [Thermoanaerobaculia bacterium]
MRTARFFTTRLAPWGLALLLSAALAPPAAPYDLTLLNLQPVDAGDFIGLQYDPAVPGARVLFEPLQPTQLTIPSYRTNMDFEVRNDEGIWLRLDSLRVEYPGSAMPALVVPGDQLLGYDSTFYTFEPKDPDKKRPAIINGGFGATGLVLQRNFDDDHLPYGRALDVVAYKPTGWVSSAYAVVGYQQYQNGPLPETPQDPPNVAHAGFLARYDAAGSLVSHRFFKGNAMEALTELGNGSFLAVGRDGDAMTVRRLILYGVKDGDATETDQITTDVSFGQEGLLQMTFEDGGTPCSIARIAGATAVNASKYMVAAALYCDRQERAGLALIDSDGDLVSTFGNQGKLVLSGPGGTPVRPVALAKKQSVLGPFVAWMAARTGGEDCFSGPHEGCQFGLTRLTLSGQDAGYGWVQTTFPEADNAIPQDMVVDSRGRVFIGGYAAAGTVRYASLARFTSTGALDAGFGDSGLTGTLIGGRDASIASLALTKNGSLAAGLGIYHEAAETNLAFGAALFSSAGALMWSHDSVQAGTLWQHNRPGQSLDYGSYLEADIHGIPEAIAVDGDDRVLAVGGIASGIIDDAPWAGPVSIAVARYLPFGEPDSRRWVKPGQTLKIEVPEDRTFSQPAPSGVIVRLDFQGGTLDDWNFQRDAAPLIQNAVDSNPAPGGYLFPIPPSELAFDEAATVSGHVLSHHHRHSAGNRFAYDIGIGRWDGSKWNGAAGGEGNAAELAWNRAVRAMADGVVVACRRSSEDNPPDGINGEPANFVEIQHAFDVLDESRQEFVSYYHLRKDSIPLSVCPNICPEDNPGCDASREGVDPDGRRLPTPVPVAAGDEVGRVGNSGTSTTPHLHVHVSTGAGGDEGEPGAGSIPLLFQQIMLGDRYDALGNQIEPSPWFGAHNMALPHTYLVRPLQ